MPLFSCFNTEQKECANINKYFELENEKPAIFSLMEFSDSTIQKRIDTLCTRRENGFDHYNMIIPYDVEKGKFDPGSDIYIPALGDCWNYQVELMHIPPNERNIIDILVNNYDQIMIEQEVISKDELPFKLLEAYYNHGRDYDLPDSPGRTIFHLKWSANTSEAMLVSVLDDIRNAYLVSLADNATRSDTIPSVKTAKELLCNNYDEIMSSNRHFRLWLAVLPWEIPPPPPPPPPPGDEHSL